MPAVRTVLDLSSNLKVSFACLISRDVFLLSQDNDVRAELSKLSRNVMDLSDLLNSRFRIRTQDGIADSLVKVAFLQLLSYYKSVSLGLDPDKPSKLTKIISS